MMKIRFALNRPSARLALALVGTAALGALATEAEAQSASGSVYYGPQPAYVAPQPVYVYPPAYYPAPAYYYPPAPAYYYPAPAYYPQPSYWAPGISANFVFGFGGGRGHGHGGHHH